MTIEERIKRLERANQRYRQMFTLIGAIAICVVGISATQDGKIPDVIRAKSFVVVNEKGMPSAILSSKLGKNIITTYNKKGIPIIVLGENEGGHGSVRTFNAEGKNVFDLTTTIDGHGTIALNNKEEKHIVRLGASVDGSGIVTTFNEKGKKMITLSSCDDGGQLTVFNKTGEFVCTLYTDEYGNGEIGAWDRKGMGRTLKPGP